MSSLGNASVPGQNYPGGVDRCFVSKFVLASNGTITGATAYFSTSSTAGGTAKFVIYTDNGSGPGTLVSASAAASVPAGGGWVNFSGMSGSLVGGNYYWLGVVGNGSQDDYGFDYVGTGSVMADTDLYSYANPPATWPGVTASYAGTSIAGYVTYTPSGGGFVFINLGSDPF